MIYFIIIISFFFGRKKHLLDNHVYLVSYLQKCNTIDLSIKCPIYNFFFRKRKNGNETTSFNSLNTVLYTNQFYYYPHIKKVLQYNKKYALFFIYALFFVLLNTYMLTTHRGPVVFFYYYYYYRRECKKKEEEKEII